MKRKIIILILINIIYPINAFATSGACSSHNGVNCAYGATLEGKVMCNDNWVNSSVYFSDTDECKSTCTPPPIVGCTNKNDAGVLANKLARMGGYLGASSADISAAATCQNQITEYQNAYQAYLSCKKNSTNNSYSSQNYSYSGTLNEKMQEYCIGKYGSPSVYNSSKITCECSPGYLMGKGGLCVTSSTYCSERIGNNSYYKEDVKMCSCNTGYAIGDDNKCFLYDDNYCIGKYGQGSWADVNTLQCHWCNSGAVKVNGQCVFPSTSTSTTTSSSTSKFQFKSNLKLGSRSDEVKQLQKLLISLKLLAATPTGYFGPSTQLALKKYQKINNLKQTGVVDETTIEALNI